MRYCARIPRRAGVFAPGSGATSGPPGRFWLWTAGLLVAIAATPAWGAPRAAIDAASQREAIEAIPFDQLTPAAQAKLWGVVSRPSLYRQMPVTVIESDPDMYLFLVRYPEVIVNMWDLMGITKVQLNRTGDFAFQASDGAGTVSHVELVYGDRDVHVMYAEGTYEGPLLKRLIGGRCVLVLQSNYARGDDQTTHVTNRLDIFLQLENVGAELVAKTLHPLVGKTADQNFVESTKFLAQVTKAAETKPLRLQQLSQRLSKITPEVRQRFSTVAAVVSQRAVARLNEQAASQSAARPRTSSVSAPSAVFSIDDHGVATGDRPRFPPDRPVRRTLPAER